MAEMLAAQLTRALERAGIPVLGVSIGRAIDRATWRVDYTAAATAQQRTDGEAIRLTFDPANDPTYADEVATAECDAKVLKALALGLWEAIPGPLLTKVQLRARIIAIWKTL
jgi:hypothetical protein